MDNDILIDEDEDIEDMENILGEDDGEEDNEDNDENSGAEDDDEGDIR